MGKIRNTLDEDLKRTRRQLSRRLMKALREGRLHDEIKGIEREGQEFWDEAMNGSRKRNTGSRNGKPRAK